MRSLRLLPRSSEIMDGSVPNILGPPNYEGLSTFIIIFDDVTSSKKLKGYDSRTVGLAR